jgi:probable F420-dependent oxidoreductase
MAAARSRIDIGRIGIWSNGLRYHADRAEAADAAAELEELGYDALFIPDIGGDVLGAASDLLAATRSIPLATGILNIWMHDAAEVAAGVAELDRLYGPRFILGLGASHASVVDAVRPGSYSRPRTAMVDYLDTLDAAPTPVSVSRRLLAALGPRMLDLAGERSAGAHPYLVPPAHTRSARARLGSGPLLAPELSVVLEPDPRQALERARAFVADYLQLPNYVNNLRRIGFAESELTGFGSDGLVRALVAMGDQQAIADRVRQHFAAGADHVAVQVIGTGETLPRMQWRQLAEILFD